MESSYTVTFNDGIQTHALVAPGYNNRLNPDISNAFAAAVMRFGHTYISDQIPFVNSAFRNDNNTRLEDVSKRLPIKTIMNLYIIFRLPFFEKKIAFTASKINQKKNIKV